MVPNCLNDECVCVCVTWENHNIDFESWEEGFSAF